MTSAVLCGGLGGAAAEPGIRTGEQDVLEGGQRRNQVEVLEHEAHLSCADPRPVAVADVDDVPAVEVQLGSRSVVEIRRVEQTQGCA